MCGERRDTVRLEEELQMNHNSRGRLSPHAHALLSLSLIATDVLGERDSDDIEIQTRSYY